MFLTSKKHLIFLINRTKWIDLEKIFVRIDLQSIFYFPFSQENLRIYKPIYETHLTLKRIKMVTILLYHLVIDRKWNKPACRIRDRSIFPALEQRKWIGKFKKMTEKKREETKIHGQQFMRLPTFYSIQSSCRRL